MRTSTPCAAIRACRVRVPRAARGPAQGERTNSSASRATHAAASASHPARKKCAPSSSSARAGRASTPTVVAARSAPVPHEIRVARDRHLDHVDERHRPHAQRDRRFALPLVVLVAAGRGRRCRRGRQCVERLSQPGSAAGRSAARMAPGTVPEWPIALSRATAASPCRVSAPARVENLTIMVSRAMIPLDVGPRSSRTEIREPGVRADGRRPEGGAEPADQAQQPHGRAARRPARLRRGHPARPLDSRRAAHGGGPWLLRRRRPHGPEQPCRLRARAWAS